MGNRIAKHVFDSDSVFKHSTYYVRDAQGNILSTYNYKTGVSSSYMLKERNMYGSSRIGINTDSLEMIAVSPLYDQTVHTTSRGLKHYELTNHLGNVLAVVSDRKLPYPNGSVVGFYQPEIVSATDYYPGGMLKPGRTFSISDYRFGFNGQENDDEVKGKGKSQNFGERHYDSRLCRFLSLDPLTAKFPWQSSYVFAGNNQIKFIDKKGLFQLDPGMAKNYPIIYKYLSTKIEKDVTNNTKIMGAYKGINPDVTEADISTIFRNGSGPVLYDIYNPGQESEAAGKLYYSKGTSSIEINTKIFDKVEKVLRESNNPSERLKATMFLFQEVTHEAAHEVMGYKNGVKVSESEQLERSRSFSYGEDGEMFEKAVWGTPEEPDHSNLRYIDGIRPGNSKNNVENLEKSLSHGANPTVPEKE